MNDLGLLGTDCGYIVRLENCDGINCLLITVLSG